MWQQDYEGAIGYFDAVINSGIYQLCPRYHENFNAEFKNTNNEAVLQVQQSVNDGAGGANGNPGDVLNLPGYDPNTCCGFHLPSQNLANAFQTDADGLPLIYTYNNTDIVNDDTLTSDDPFTPHAGPLDPRHHAQQPHVRRGGRRNDSGTARRLPGGEQQQRQLLQPDEEE